MPELPQLRERVAAALVRGLTVWRWRTRQRGGGAATGPLYPVAALVGLVFTHGVGGAAVNP